jgi:hypothetical protein
MTLDGLFTLANDYSAGGVDVFAPATMTFNPGNRYGFPVNQPFTGYVLFTPAAYHSPGLGPFPGFYITPANFTGLLMYMGYAVTFYIQPGGMPVAAPHGVTFTPVSAQIAYRGKVGSYVGPEGVLSGTEGNLVAIALAAPEIDCAGSRGPLQGGL